MSKRIAVLLADGFEDIEAVAIIDVLRRAEFDVKVAGVGGDVITSAQGLKVSTDVLVGSLNADSLDMIVLPGGFDGTEILVSNPETQKLLKEMDDQNKHIGAICAAPLALKSAGVLKDSYTCYPGVEEIVKHDGFRDDVAVVSDRNILTSRGPGTAICFALEIVKMHGSIDKYNQLKEGLLATYC